MKSEILEKQKVSLKDFKIDIFMATWCDDSRREVPRLIKIMEHLHLPNNKMTIINLYRNPPNYKQSPDREEKGLNIHRVPTFIFYKKGIEVGRIVESPVI